MRPRAIAGLLVVLALGCVSPVQPSKIVGSWSGYVGPSHQDTMQIDFFFEGGHMVGLACQFSGFSVVKRGIPVEVRGKSVSVLNFEGEFTGGPKRTLQLHSTANTWQRPTLFPGAGAPCN